MFRNGMIGKLVYVYFSSTQNINWFDVIPLVYQTIIKFDINASR